MCKLTPTSHAGSRDVFITGRQMRGKRGMWVYKHCLFLTGCHYFPRLTAGLFRVLRPSGSEKECCVAWQWKARRPAEPDGAVGGLFCCPPPRWWVHYQIYLHRPTKHDERKYLVPGGCCLHAWAPCRTKARERRPLDDNLTSGGYRREGLTGV